MSEICFTMTTANGHLQRVSASKLKQWQEWQEKVKNDSFTPEDKAKIAKISKDLLKVYRQEG